ncbi:homoserine kinase [Clostridium bovifaecis]|uniref:Homoserine kinase n=1 Tax=Clostridium bovifaecis TaxID=2184719 RepID=A0A6I6F830_9CLOT|nr:homoserine kinase [Clostridium bovifaecis]
MIKVRVPATTANIGSGFDSFGMALSMYNEICIEEIEDGIKLLQEGQPSEIPLAENLLYTSFINTLDKYNYIYKGFRIDVTQCNIPISRGLGSSAACIVAGIMAANALMRNALNVNEIINAAVEIEGHPDNIVPAVVGGMVISLVECGKVIYSKIKVPEDLSIAVIIPNFKLSTEASRAVLPKSYSREECVFNISRASMLVNAMNNCELDKLRISVQDKIHQDYRKDLIRNIDDIFREAQEQGSLAEFISGSGSTLVSIIDKKNYDFSSNMKKFLNKLEDKWEINVLQPDLEGARIKEEIRQGV